MWKRMLPMLLGSVFFAWSAQPVAVIAAVEGLVTVTDAEHVSATAHHLEWLPAGAVLETADRARVVVAFANGRRYEIGARGKVSITAEGPAGASGPVRELEGLPPMPKLPVIASANHATAMAGLRIRELNDVYLRGPGSTSWTLPEHTVLRFESDVREARYRIEVADTNGAVVYQAESKCGEVVVPAGTLEPGSDYSWRVLTLRGDPLARAGFRTAPADLLASRATFKAAIAESDLEFMAVLAAIDAQLGLYDEVHEELRALSARGVRAERLQQLLAALEDVIR